MMKVKKLYKVVALLILSFSCCVPLHTGFSPYVEEQQPPKPETRKIIVEATAYCKDATMGGRDDGLMASGVYGIPHEHCAMENVPFGTVIILPDGTRRVVADRFGHGKDGYLDLYMNDTDECYEYGRKTIEIEVLL